MSCLYFLGNGAISISCLTSFLRTWNVYIVTGGAIKLTATMQEREHTQKELDKLNACRDFLKANGVFDQDSFIDFSQED